MGSSGVVVLGAVAGVTALVAAERADAGTMVDITWRLAGDYHNINYLADKTTLDPAVTGSSMYDDLWGAASFADGSDVPTDGWKLILIDNGGQPVGIRSITSIGEYQVKVYGDLPWTTGVDEGASINTPVAGMFESPDGIFYDAQLTPSCIFGDVEGPVNIDAMVTTTILPDPSTLALLGAGAGMAALMRRRRK